MLRRTKIVATLGPATDAPQVLEQMLLAGVNVVRLNFSHGEAEEHQARPRMVREISARHNLNVAILADLQGPKIRVRSFRDGKVALQRGAPFALDATLDEFEGDIHQVGIDYPALPADCRPGDILLLDDGRIELRVDSITTHRIDTEVLVGGPLSNHKGINRQGGGLSAPALSDKDEADIVTAAAIGVDFVAVSFVRSAEDIDTARQLIREAGSQAAVVAWLPASRISCRAVSMR
ncbi:MAG TPA: pyruvate kinase, partial [Pseudomonadales bacterium]|nr:pyruvate kinase [Pseudomonadales bacterium]